MHRFTLIELVLIISVGILALALLPGAADSAKMDAVSVNCQNSLRELGKNIFSYSQDNKGLLPAGHTAGADSAYRWYNAVSPYLRKAKQTFPVCAAAKKPNNSYGVNYCYTKNRNAKLPFYYYSSMDSGNSKFQRYAALAPEILMLADGDNYFMVSPLQLGCAPSRDVSGNGIKDSCRAADYNHFAPMRHNGKSNYLAGDLSVKSLSFDDWEDSMNNSGILYDEEYNLQ